VQEDVLNKMGVDYIQGYLHSKPLSKSEFIDFIQEHNNGIKKEEVKPKRGKKKQSN
jgi:sensor c-di-GMP phosphodiesterase-like protein